MSRKRKLIRQKKSVYLNADFEEVQAALDMQPVHTVRYVPCDAEDCAGIGLPGDPCPICKFVLPKRSSNVPVQIPASVKNGTPTVVGTGHYGHNNATEQGSFFNGYGGTGYTHEQHNHKGDSIVYDFDGKKLYAANMHGLDEYSGAWDLIIDLANNVRWGDPFGFVKEKSSKRFAVLRKYTNAQKKIQSEVLDLAWPDMQPPPCNLDFWIQLWSMLPEKTVAACVGGHGRTGSCLAALMIASGEDYYTAVDLVRTKHCSRAIETLKQEEYLHKLYIQMLERNIAHEEDPKLLADLQADLAYAQEYVPNSFSSFGEKEPAKKKNHSTLPLPPIGPPGTSFSHDGYDPRLKMVGNNLYEQMCVNVNCKAKDCRNKDHQGWVDYDPAEDETLWAH